MFSLLKALFSFAEALQRISIDICQSSIRRKIPINRNLLYKIILMGVLEKWVYIIPFAIFGAIGSVHHEPNSIEYFFNSIVAGFLFLIFYLLISLWAPLRVIREYRKLQLEDSVEVDKSTNGFIRAKDNSINTKPDVNNLGSSASCNKHEGNADHNRIIETPETNNSIAYKLNRIDSLHASGVISDLERINLRSKILDDLV